RRHTRWPRDWSSDVCSSDLEGFLDVVVDPPRYKFQPQSDDVDVVVPIHEGRQYSFGHIIFTGQTVYGAEALRPQLLDLLQRPYRSEERRVGKECKSCRFAYR